MKVMFGERVDIYLSSCTPNILGIGSVMDLAFSVKTILVDSEGRLIVLYVDGSDGCADSYGERTAINRPGGFLSTSTIVLGIKVVRAKPLFA